jgi:CBS domain-containing protein
MRCFSLFLFAQTMVDASDASCAPFMTTNPVVLRRGDTVGDALRLMLKHRQLGLPVCEEDGRYLGMFVRSGLVALLLPRGVTVPERSSEGAQLSDVSFLSDTFDDARHRFQQVAGERVDRHLQAETPLLHPDTPIINALLYLSRARTLLPVVDRRTRKLVGTISTWDLLTRVAAAEPSRRRP